jgi:hypothetical protein
MSRASEKNEFCHRRVLDRRGGEAEQKPLEALVEFGSFSEELEISVVKHPPEATVYPGRKGDGVSHPYREPAR